MIVMDTFLDPTTRFQSDYHVYPDLWSSLLGGASQRKPFIIIFRHHRPHHGRNQYQLFRGYENTDAISICLADEDDHIQIHSTCELGRWCYTIYTAVQRIQHGMLPDLLCTEDQQHRHCVPSPSRRFQAASIFLASSPEPEEVNISAIRIYAVPQLCLIWIARSKANRPSSAFPHLRHMPKRAIQMPK